jgi:hypothetical protein
LALGSVAVEGRLLDGCETLSARAALIGGRPGILAEKGGELVAIGGRFDDAQRANLGPNGEAWRAVHEECAQYARARIWRRYWRVVHSRFDTLDTLPSQSRKEDRHQRPTPPQTTQLTPSCPGKRAGRKRLQLEGEGVGGLTHALPSAVNRADRPPQPRAVVGLAVPRKIPAVRLLRTFGVGHSLWRGPARPSNSTACRPRRRAWQDLRDRRGRRSCTG